MLKNPPKRLSPLARRRMARGWTQKEFARHLNVNPATVHGWESGKFRPEPSRFKDIAEWLRIEPLKLAEILEEGIQ